MLLSNLTMVLAGCLTFVCLLKGLKMNKKYLLLVT